MISSRTTVMSTLCVAFDLDDTLYLERDYIRSGFVAVGQWAAATLEIKHYGEKAWALFEQGVRGTIFNEALHSLDRAPEPLLISKMVDIYRNHEPNICLLPDAVECLRSLRGRTIVGIITDGPLLSQRAKLRTLRLAEYCNLIVCTDRWGKEFYKPHPRAFEFIQTRAGRGDLAFTYVGDNPAKDFVGPRTLGWDTIRVRRKQGLHFAEEAAVDASPRVEVADLSRICEILDLPATSGA